MSNAKRSRRAVAAGLATMVLAPALPAAAEARAPALGCRWANGNAIKIAVDYGSLPAGYASFVMQASAGWNQSANIDISGASSKEAANIWVKNGTLGGNEVGSTAQAAGTNGLCTGRAEISVDNAKIATRPHVLALLQWTVSHEIGHAIGLDHDAARSSSAKCADGRAAPFSVMATPAVIFASSGICNPLLPTGEDIASIDAVYNPVGPVK